MHSVGFLCYNFWRDLQSVITAQSPPTSQQLHPLQAWSSASLSLLPVKYTPSVQVVLHVIAHLCNHFTLAITAYGQAPNYTLETQ